MNMTNNIAQVVFSDCKDEFACRIMYPFRFRFENSNRKVQRVVVVLQVIHSLPLLLKQILVLIPNRRGEG